MCVALSFVILMMVQAASDETTLCKVCSLCVALSFIMLNH